MYSTQESCYTRYQRVHSSLPYIGDDVTIDHSRLYVEGYQIGALASSDTGWAYDCLKSAPIDYDTVLIWCDWSGTAKLYYGNVWGDADFSEFYESRYFDESNLTVLLENCVCEPCWSFDLNVLKFRYTTLTETVFYNVVTDKNGVPIAVNSETYLAPEQAVITLQPINK